MYELILILCFATALVGAIGASLWYFSIKHSTGELRSMNLYLMLGSLVLVGVGVFVFFLEITLQANGFMLGVAGLSAFVSVMLATGGYQFRTIVKKIK
jgi:hypothetical protein